MLPYTAKAENLPSISITTPVAGLPDSLFLIALVIGGCTLLYLWLWFNRTRLFDMPTIAEAAFLMEKWSIEKLGEREFSRRLLDFEQMVDGQPEQALKLLATQIDGQTRQIGYCWLERRGYGKKSMQWLWQTLEGLEEHRSCAITTNPNNNDLWPQCPPDEPIEIETETETETEVKCKEAEEES